jgi:hypothetical protein
MEIVDYAAAAAGAGRVDVLTARGEHDLSFVGVCGKREGRRKVWSEWVATLPMEMSGALAATPWPVLGELVLPHLRLAEAAKTLVPAEVVYTAEAWNQWLQALESLQYGKLWESSRTDSTLRKYRTSALVRFLCYVNPVRASRCGVYVTKKLCESSRIDRFTLKEDCGRGQGGTGFEFLILNLE